MTPSSKIASNIVMGDWLDRDYDIPGECWNSLEKHIAKAIDQARKEAVEEVNNNPPPWFVRTEDCEEIEKKARKEAFLRAAEIIENTLDDTDTENLIGMAEDLYRRGLIEKIRAEAGE